MDFLKKLNEKSVREQVLQSLVALATFIALPLPNFEAPSIFVAFIVVEWILTGAWVWSFVFAPEMNRVFYFSSLLVGLVLLIKLKFFLHPFLLLLFVGWKHFRTLRLQKRAGTLSKVFIALALSAHFFASVPVSAQDEISEEELRKMEAEIGDLNDLMPKASNKKKKNKAKKDEGQQYPSSKEEQKKVMELASPPPAPENSSSTSSIESVMPLPEASTELPITPDPVKIEQVEVPEAEKVEIVMPSAKELKKVQGKKLPKKLKSEDDVEDPSTLTRREKSAILNQLPKPNEVRDSLVFESQRDVNLPELPKYLTGYEVIDFSSCSVYDDIPWKFSPDRRKRRLLIKDKLRHQTESIFKTWEIHQVMDGEGYVSYVFRNALADGRYDSIVIKDTIYNRFIETPKGKKQTELQDLKSLVNRQALAFYSLKGGTISLMPSSIGKSALVIQQGKAEGRLLPPLYIRGNTCDRPDDDEDSDKQSKEDNLGDKGISPKK